MKTRIATVRDVVAALGGVRGAASFWGVSENRVYNIIHENRIPGGAHLPTYLRLTMEGYVVDLGVFGLDVKRDLGLGRPHVAA